MSVSAIIVTRGDVDLRPVFDSLPEEWEVLVWANGAGALWKWTPDRKQHDVATVNDMSVYGRYAAIEYASGKVIYVQDDDCIVSDPQAIVDTWEGVALELGEVGGCNTDAHVVCNMPQEFRHDFYRDHALVGFGAAFHRDAPARAFDRWYASPKTPGANGEWGLISRTCDIIFTGLTQRILVDITKTNLPYAEDDNRMWKQPEHQGERAAMRELMLQVKKETL